MRWPTLTELLGIAAVLLTLLACFVWWVLHSLGEGVACDQAMTVAYLTLAEHIRKTGEWPTGPADLDHVTVDGPQYGSRYFWPRDKAVVLSKVKIDFSLTCGRVAADRSLATDSVKPIGARYYESDYSLEVWKACLIGKRDQSTVKPR